MTGALDIFINNPAVILTVGALMCLAIPRHLASPILLANYTADPYQWMASGTLTFDIRPVPDHFAIKVEYRHDHARSDIFFRGTVTGDGSTMMPYVANAPKQDTLMLGLHAWF